MGIGDTILIGYIQLDNLKIDLFKLSNGQYIVKKALFEEQEVLPYITEKTHTLIDPKTLEEIEYKVSEQENKLLVNRIFKINDTITKSEYNLSVYINNEIKNILQVEYFILTKNTTIKHIQQIADSNSLKHLFHKNLNNLVQGDSILIAKIKCDFEIILNWKFEI